VSFLNAITHHVDKGYVFHRKSDSQEAAEFSIELSVYRVTGSGSIPAAKFESHSSDEISYRIFDEVLRQVLSRDQSRYVNDSGCISAYSNA